MGLSPPRSSGPMLATALSAEMNPAFGRYVLLDRIGEGGMSEVFRAKLTGAESFTKLVAIKRLKPNLAMMPEAVNQFIDEARLGSVLSHSNIASVSDFGRVGDGYYLAEEYIAGRTLAEISARHAERYGAPVPLAFVLYIASEVLSALAYAHERTDDDGRPLGIVHRDISPTNIMVSFEGEVKLLDFGIGKSVDRVSQTREGAIKGNVGYMAPEQARGQEVNALADLFSLGLVIFDLLSGEPFYQGRGAGEVLFQAATGPTAEHVARIGRLPPPVPDLLRTVLSIDPAGRFPSARAFALAFGAPMTIAKTQLSVLMSSLFRNKI
jgi:serine/threonine protein kinase